MSAGAAQVARTGPAATIDRLSCRIRPPREGVDHGALSWRLDQVLAGRLTGALGDALDGLATADEGAVWVIRSMRSDVVVSATDRDLDRLSALWAGQLADAIIAVIRGGPSANVVRFASHAEYLAAFVAALTAGRADTWMFAPLAGLRLLRPAAALRTGAAGAGVPAAAVLAALVAAGRLETVIAAISPAEASALWAACVEEALVRGVPRRQLVHAVRAAAAAELPVPLLAAGGGVLALRLFGAVAARLGYAPDCVAAIDVVVRGADTRTLSFRARGERSVPPTALDPGPSAALAGPAEASGTGAVESAPRGDSDSRVFAAAGAPSFLLLPSLERIGLAGQPAAARLSALALALRCEPDEALKQAAGEGDDAEDVNAPRVLQAVRAALRDDQRIDGRWLLGELVAHPDGRRQVALVRDIGSDLWLAGSIQAPGQAVDWTALVEEVLRDIGIVPQAVLGAAGAPCPPAGDGDCDAALRTLRPPDADIEWLAPRDDTALACGLAARAASRDLARRLIGFGRSSMPYLAQRFLPLGGIVTESRELIHAELSAAPLAVILVMAGLDRISFRVPWLEPEVLVTHRSG
jgi:hypothetical protein